MLAPHLLRAFLRQNDGGGASAGDELPGMQQLRDALSDEDDAAAVEPSTKRRRASGAGACARGGGSDRAGISDAEARGILFRLAKELATFTAAVEPENTPKKLRLLPVHEGSTSLKTLPSYIPLLRLLQRRGARAEASKPQPAQNHCDGGNKNQQHGGRKKKKKKRGPRPPRWQRGGRKKRGRYARRHGRRRRRPPRQRKHRGRSDTRVVLATFSLLPVPPPGKVPFWRLNRKASRALRDILAFELDQAGEQSSVDEIFGMKIKHGALRLSNRFNDCSYCLDAPSAHHLPYRLSLLVSMVTVLVRHACVRLVPERRLGPGISARPQATRAKARGPICGGEGASGHPTTH